MDTRSKIISPAGALALGAGSQPVALVTGHFDVLQAADAGDLCRARQRFPEAILLVAVLPPPQPLHEPSACAGMVAALAVVDYVVSLSCEQISAFVAAFPAGRVIRLEAAQQQRMRALTEHVKRRQHR